MLEFIQVQKSFGARQIFDIPHFRLENGLYWLQGPNGAGKTTLLRMIAGILKFKGDIRLKDRSMRKEPIGYRKLVSWADAEPLYPGFLTGVDLQSFYRQLLKTENVQTENLSERLGIGGWLGTCASTWSSGMTKKISLLLALLSRPALIVLDEPFITLDQRSSAELSAIILEYHQQNATAFLLSSHQDPELPNLRSIKINDQSIRLI